MFGIFMVALPAGFSPEDYLVMERDSVVRHEYRQGLVYAMAGGSDGHSRIAINLLTEINLHLRNSDCQFFSSDVKVSHADAFFYYPDAFVTCDLRDRNDRYIKRYPKLIAEVLSPSTASFDRGEKFKDYQRFGSLEEYVLVSQDELIVECRRLVGDVWKTEIYGVGGRVVLQSIGLEFAIEALYRGVLC